MVAMVRYSYELAFFRTARNRSMLYKVYKNFCWWHVNGFRMKHFASLLSMSMSSYSFDLGILPSCRKADS